MYSLRTIFKKYGLLALIDYFIHDKYWVRSLFFIRIGIYKPIIKIRRGVKRQTD